ncbi:MAG: hypothetical protein QW738_05160 [Nitrososphaeria archaeon]
MGPVSQATYPRFSKMASESKDLAFLWARRMLIFYGNMWLRFIYDYSRRGTPTGYKPSIPIVRILAGLSF